MSEDSGSSTHSANGDRAQRRRSVVTSGHIGDEAGARKGLADVDADVRASSLRALERMKALTSTELAAGLKDPSELVRRSGVLIAAGREDVLPELLNRLEDNSGVVVEAAAFALGERSGLSVEVVGRLTQIAVDHEDSLCREAAVAALGSIGDPSGLGAVVAACSDKATVRRRAVLALAAFEGDIVTAKLEELCLDRDLQVRQSAEELLAIELGEQL